MFASSIKMLLRHNGVDAEIRRNGEVVIKTQALDHIKESYIDILPDTDIREGDEVFFPLSEKTFVIQRVEKRTIQREIVAMRAHYQSPSRHDRPSMIVHGSVIHAQSILNSAIQQHSSGASQTITFGTNEKEKSKAAIRLVLEVLDDLDLETVDKESLRAEAKSADVLAASPKVNTGLFKTILLSIRDQVAKGVSGKVGEAVISRGHAAIQAINDCFTSTGGS